MNAIETTTLPNRVDRAVAQLASQNNDPGARERSARAYVDANRADSAIERTAALANAPAAMEIGGSGHVIQAFANYGEPDADGTVHVRIVDALTTRTVSEQKVGDRQHDRTQVDDYGILRFGMKPRVDHIQ
jgi:hypothetical protein